MRYEEVADRLWPLWIFWLPFGLARATQIVLFDRILDAPRKWWLRKVNPHDYPPGDDRLSLIAYVSMCIFCMSVDIGLFWAAMSGIPVLGDIAVIVLAALAASFWVPIIDHWGDKLLSDKKAMSAEEIAAWSHGGVKVVSVVEERTLAEPEVDDVLAALEGDDDGKT